MKIFIDIYIYIIPVVECCIKKSTNHQPNPVLSSGLVKSIIFLVTNPTWIY